MIATPDNETRHLISTEAPTRADRQLAIAIVAVSALTFAVTTPFARQQLAAVPAFVASYQSALAINDIVTATLIFQQFKLARSRAILLVASGYLFTAAVAIIHALTFPGLFTPTGLLNAGSQTTVWLYMLWHGGFPLLIISYAVLRGRDGDRADARSSSGAIAACILAALIAAGVAGLIATAGHESLPILLADGRYTPSMIVVVTSIWSLSFVALLVLFFRKRQTVLDVWLMVVMCVWIFDIGMSAVLNAGRFDLGFYLGRIYGLVAASIVLIVLLFETGALQVQLARLIDATRRRADSALSQEIEERQRLFETSLDLIYVTDPQGTFVQVSPSSLPILGYRPDEMVGHSAIEFIDQTDLENTRNEMRAIRRGRVMRNFVTRYMHRDGRSVALTWMGVWSEQVRRYYFSGRDMTEVLEAQEDLLESGRMARGIIETALDGFIQMDAAGVVLDWNNQAEKIFGWTREQALGRVLSELIIPEGARSHHDMGLRHFLDTGEGPILDTRFEVEAQRRDGSRLTVELSVTAFHRRGGHVFNGFVRDLTEKIARETQYRQAQKMEAIGQLTGGVAHDFNNILTVITGTIEILAEAVADRDDLAAITKMIDDAAQRGADLTKHLLAFARRQPLQPREVDVNGLVVATAKLLRPTLGEQIQIHTALTEAPWLAFVDPNQLTTAILNLALNARDAMPDGGKLTIETQNVELDESYAALQSEVRAGSYALVAISDTGSGIPPGLLEKVFEPFFTTKEPGKGTGLGLSMVYGFVKQSQGHIKIYSEYGHGTTVKLYLPRSAEAVAAAPLDAPVDRLERGTEVVLVVEDDALVRNYVMTQVRSLGYRAIAAPGAEEALRIIRSDAEIDLLFTDVIMPGSMNGPRLVSEALKLRPRLGVLYTSGYTENAVVHHGRLDPGVLLLAKPYRKSDLARMLRLALRSVDADADAGVPAKV